MSDPSFDPKAYVEALEVEKATLNSMPRNTPEGQATKDRRLAEIADEIKKYSRAAAKAS